MTPVQVSYVVDVVLGFIGGGLLAAFTQLSTTGVLDWHSLAVAFAFGAAGFLRKWLSVNVGTDSVPVPKAPDLIAITPRGAPPIVPPADVLVDGHLLPPRGVG